jgi:RNA-splicing ligase RtcB
MSLFNFPEKKKDEERRCAGFDQCMPNTYTKSDGRMNKRQEVMRTTFNTYGHNSNRHLDRKDCKEEIREGVKKEEEEKEEENGKLKKKDIRNSRITCPFQFLMTFFMLLFLFFY